MQNDSAGYWFNYCFPFMWFSSWLGKRAGCSFGECNFKNRQKRFSGFNWSDKCFGYGAVFCLFVCNFKNKDRCCCSNSGNNRKSFLENSIINFDCCFNQWIGFFFSYKISCKVFFFKDK